MQLGRLVRRGLVSWTLNPRAFLASRLGPVRNVRVWVAINESSDDLPDGEADDRRLPGSRRTLFQHQAPAASLDTLTSQRELLDIHKQSLQSAGVELTPFEIEQNRLHSVRSALRRETRGPVRAAVSREFRAAERRLYSSARRTRKDEDDGEEEKAREGEEQDQQLQQQQRQAAQGAQRSKSEKVKGPNPADISRASKVAARYVAAHVARKKQAAAAEVASTDDDDSDDDDDDDGDAAAGEVEGEESFSLEELVQELRRTDYGAQAGKPSAAADPSRKRGSSVRPVTDLAPEPIRGPKLTHDLPPALNLRLLEAVLAGSNSNFIPQIPMGASGINNGLINSIMTAWRTHELVKLRIRDRRKVAKKYLPYMNKVCEVLESRSGGVVVWRSGRSIWMYRGEQYKPVDTKKLAEDLLGKAEVPVYCAELSASRPLLGREVRLPQVGQMGYLTRGSTELAGNDPAGLPSSPGGVGVIFLHDAFGPGSPDTQEHCKQLCDLLSSLVGPGTPVLLPDLTNGGQDRWRGPLWPPNKPIYERQSGWLSKEGRGSAAAVAPYIDAAVSYMRGPDVGASRLVLVGTGWGGWLAANMLAADATKLHIEAEAAAARAAGTASGAATADAVAAATKDSAADAAAAYGRTAAGSDSNGASKSAASVLGAAAVQMVEAAERELPAEAGPLERGLWMLFGPEAKSYRQAKSLALYGGRRPKRMDPDVYDGEGLIFSAGVVGSANHFFDDEERLALAISVPMCFVSSKWDPMEKFQLFMMPPLVDKCAFKRFGKIKPGFWGKMAEWSDPVQRAQATQAAHLAGWFLRWHVAGDAVARERVLKYCMIGKSGVGEKQTTNLGFPWLEQVLLFRGHEKQAKVNEKQRRQELGLPEVVTRKERDKKARQEAKKAREAARKQREAARIEREQRPGDQRSAGRRDPYRGQRGRNDGDRDGDGGDDGRGRMPSPLEQRPDRSEYGTSYGSRERGGDHWDGGPPPSRRDETWGRGRERDAYRDDVGDYNGREREDGGRMRKGAPSSRPPRRESSWGPGRSERRTKGDGVRGGGAARWWEGRGGSRDWKDEE